MFKRNSPRHSTSPHETPDKHQELASKMSSGYGLNGGMYHFIRIASISGLYRSQWLTIPYLGPSRCFPFWQEVLACYVVNTNTEDDSGKKKCVPVLEDYYECLHHKKEVGSHDQSQPQSSAHLVALAKLSNCRL